MDQMPDLKKQEIQPKQLDFSDINAGRLQPDSLVIFSETPKTQNEPIDFSSIDLIEIEKP